MKNKLVALRIELAQFEKLERMAKRDDRSVSWIIRRAISEFLKRKK